jgi:hypothetical protein
MGEYRKVFINENYADNGEFSHYELTDGDGYVLCSEEDKDKIESLESENESLKKELADLNYEYLTIVESKIKADREIQSQKEKEGKFAEWCTENDWIYDDDIYRWCKKYNQIIKKTTSELMEEYEIFNQNK